MVEVERVVQRRRKLIKASERLEEREEIDALEVLREELSALSEELMAERGWSWIKLPIKERPASFPRLSDGGLGLYYREWKVKPGGSMEFFWTDGLTGRFYPLTPGDELIVGIKTKEILQEAIKGEWQVEDETPYPGKKTPPSFWVLVPKEAEASESE